MHKLLNFLIYQTGWIACVLGAALGWPWVGTAFALAALAWHLHRAGDAGPELRLVLAVAAIGALWDSALAATGLVRFANGALFEGAAPHWMVALWVLFATTLNVSLAWLKPRRLAAALLGALGGPLAYLAGAKAGALTLPAPSLALPILALGWAAITPLLFALARRHDGHGANAASQLEPRHV